MQVSVMLARFPGNFSEHPRSSDWVIDTYHKCKIDPRISRVERWWKSDTPITMSRNEACSYALQLNMDYIAMIDSDMHPDAYVGMDPSAKPFWDSSLEFLLKQKEPCMIAVPYCGPPPHENIYVFEWTDFNDDQDRKWRLDQFSRSQAALMQGITEVGALPTGLCIIDLRIFKTLAVPWFDYEWKDDGKKCTLCGQPKPGPRKEKASTEDVYFSRNAGMIGFPTYCNWDAWAGHIKPKTVGKPNPTCKDEVHRTFQEAVARGINREDRIVQVGNVRPKRPPEGAKIVTENGSGFFPKDFEAIAPKRVLPAAKVEQIYGMEADAILGNVKQAGRKDGDDDGII
jgi:hypothetical protein